MLMPSCLTEGHIRGTRPSLPALLPTSSSIGEWRGGCVVAAAVIVVVVVIVDFVFVIVVVLDVDIVV